jgi:hypothetical protein
VIYLRKRLQVEPDNFSGTINKNSKRNF